MFSKHFKESVDYSEENSSQKCFQSLRKFCSLSADLRLQTLDLVLLLLVAVFSFGVRGKDEDSPTEGGGGGGGGWTQEGLQWVEQCQLYYFTLLHKGLESRYAGNNSDLPKRSHNLSSLSYSQAVPQTWFRQRSRCRLSPSFLQDNGQASPSAHPP